MSEIMITDALISAGIVFALGLIYFVNKSARTKTANELIKCFNELSVKNDVSFTHKDVFENFIIGLDELRRKLFVLRKADNKFQLQVINLEEIDNCSSKKAYKRTEWGDARQKYTSQVEEVLLEFEYDDKRPSIQISFYESGKNRLFALSEMEQKAQRWEAILAKTIHSRSSVSIM